MTTDATSLLERHLTAFAAGDLDAIVGDYTHDAVMITQDGTFRGPEEIRGFFGGLLEGPFAPGTYDLTMDSVTAAGTALHIVWHASCASADVLMATDTFVLRGGRIATQTYAALFGPK
ncbi:MAG: nuclear transport factor 2 family protein [Thermoleophilia bacterium]